jgi:hypothetical protein
LLVSSMFSDLMRAYAQYQSENCRQLTRNSSHTPDQAVRCEPSYCLR